MRYGVGCIVFARKKPIFTQIFQKVYQPAKWPPYRLGMATFDVYWKTEPLLRITVLRELTLKKTPGNPLHEDFQDDRDRPKNRSSKRPLLEYCPAKPDIRIS